VIVEGEPDPSLFTVPSHYIEMPPSEALLKSAQAIDPDEDNPFGPGMDPEEIDADYYENRYQDSLP